MYYFKQDLFNLIIQAEFMCKVAKFSFSQPPHTCCSFAEGTFTVIRRVALEAEAVGLYVTSAKSSFQDALVLNTDNMVAT